MKYPNDDYVWTAYEDCNLGRLDGDENEYNCIGGPKYMKWINQYQKNHYGIKVNTPPRYTNQSPQTELNPNIAPDVEENKKRLFLQNRETYLEDDDYATNIWHTNRGLKDDIRKLYNKWSDHKFDEWKDNHYVDFNEYNRIHKEEAGTDWDSYGPSTEKFHTTTTKYVPYLPTLKDTDNDNYTYVPVKGGETLKVQKMSPVPGLEMDAAPQNAGIEGFTNNTNKFVALDTIEKKKVIEGMRGVAEACDEGTHRPTEESHTRGSMTQMNFTHAAGGECLPTDPTFQDVPSNTSGMTDGMHLLLNRDGLQDVMIAASARKNREDAMNRIAAKSRLNRLQMSTKLGEAIPQYYLATGEKHYIMDMMEQKELADEETRKAKDERNSKVRHSEIATYYRKQFQMKKRIIAETAFVFFIIYVLYMLRSKDILPAELFNVFVVLILFVFIFFRLSWSIIDYSLRDNKYFDKYNWGTPADSVYNTKVDLGLAGRHNSSYSSCSKNDYSTLYSEFVRLLYYYEERPDELTTMVPEQYAQIAERYEQFIERLFEDGKDASGSVSSTEVDWPNTIENMMTSLEAQISAKGEATQSTINDLKIKSIELYNRLNPDWRTRLNKQIHVKITAMVMMIL